MKAKSSIFLVGITLILTSCGMQVPGVNDTNIPMKFGTGVSIGTNGIKVNSGSDSVNISKDSGIEIDSPDGSVGITPDGVNIESSSGNVNVGTDSDISVGTGINVSDKGVNITNSGTEVSTDDKGTIKAGGVEVSPDGDVKGLDLKQMKNY